MPACSLCVAHYTNELLRDLTDCSAISSSRAVVTEASGYIQHTVHAAGASDVWLLHGHYGSNSTWLDSTRSTRRARQALLAT